MFVKTMVECLAVTDYADALSRSPLHGQLLLRCDEYRRPSLNERFACSVKGTLYPYDGCLEKPTMLN